MERPQPHRQALGGGAGDAGTCRLTGGTAWKPGRRAAGHLGLGVSRGWVPITCIRVFGGMKGDLRAWLPGTGGGGPMGVLLWYPTLFWGLDSECAGRCPLLNLGSLWLLEPGVWFSPEPTLGGVHLSPAVKKDIAIAAVSPFYR